MQCVLLFLAVCTVGAACLFRNPTVFRYPLHASCNVTWTFEEACDGVANKIMAKAEEWGPNASCGTGQKCLYKAELIKSGENLRIEGTHTTPKAGYVDNIEYNFYRNPTDGCNVQGFSTSRLFFAVLDFGTNYCNIHNLVDGAGLQSDPKYTELTRDEICTQYSSADCEKY